MRASQGRGDMEGDGAADMHIWDGVAPVNCGWWMEPSGRRDGYQEHLTQGISKHCSSGFQRRIGLMVDLDTDESEAYDSTVGKGALGRDPKNLLLVEGEPYTARTRVRRSMPLSAAVLNRTARILFRLCLLDEQQCPRGHCQSKHM